MKRITFLATFIIALMSFGAAKAQVSAHIGINIGQPRYYAQPVYYAPRPVYYEPRTVYYREPQRVVVVNRPVYRRSYRNVYYRRPVVVRHGYYAPRAVHYRDHGHGHGHGHGRW